MTNDRMNNEDAVKARLANSNYDSVIQDESNEEMSTTSIDVHLTSGIPESGPVKLSMDSFAMVMDEEFPETETLDSATKSDSANESNQSISDEKQYKCYICDKLFSRNSSLKCHIRLHLEGPANILRKGSNQLPSNAIVIDREDHAFNNKYSLLDGQDDTLPNGIAPNEEGLYECHLCSRTFDRKKGLFRHIGYHNSLMEHSSKAAVDSIESTGSDIDLSIVDETSLDDESDHLFECTKCGKRFKTSRAMKIHSTHAHRQSSIDDEDEQDVAEEMSSENSEESEEEENEEELQFECDYCGRLFHSQRAKSIHSVHAHTGKLSGGGKFIEKPITKFDDSELLRCFKCAFCQHEFETARMLNVHVIDQHKDGSSFQCVVCERKFDSLKQYGDHTRAICGKAQIQNGMYVYGCDECPKTFAHPKSMSRHMREHRINEQETLDHLTKVLHEESAAAVQSQELRGSEEQFKCAFCAKTYSNVKALAGHMKVHNRANGNANAVHQVSTVSPLKTSASSSDSNHRVDALTGEDIRLYPCAYCDRTFTSNVGYAGHMKVHKDRTPAAASSTTSSNAGHSAVIIDDGSVVGAEIGKIFVCKICHKKFTSGVQLGGHMRHHTAAMKANAEVQQNSLHVNAVTADVKANDVVDEYICDTCDKSFLCKKELSEHVQLHISDGQAFGKLDEDGGLLCEYCDRPFNGVKSLKTHMYRYHRSVMMRSSKARAKFEEEKVYKCDACHQSFTYLSELKQHTTGECAGESSSATTTTTTAAASSSRKRSSTEDSSWRCEYCDQTFMLHCHLLKHTKTCYNRNEEALTDAVNGDANGETCSANKRIRKSTFMSSMYEYEPIGSRRCLQKQQPHVNLRAEFGDKPYECVYCEKSFGKKEELLKHVHTHTELQGSDDEDFNNYINLHAEEHFAIQTQDGDEEHFIFEQYDDNEGYQCSECDETYRDKLQMIIHMSFHVNSKLPNNGYNKSSLIIKADSTLLAPYKCKFCDERFINKNYRSRHLCKCHQDRILQCEICEKLFLYKETLKQHCKQHMIDTKYRCEHCQKCFTSKWFLKRHMRRHCMKRFALEELRAQSSLSEQVADDADAAAEYHNHFKSETIETQQADSEIIVEHFIKDEMPQSEVVMHMQMQSV